MILMIVDPSFESLRLAEKVGDMAARIGVPLYYILNRTNLFSAVRLRRSMPDSSWIACEIPQDSAIATLADTLDATRKGRA